MWHAQPQATSSGPFHTPARVWVFLGERLFLPPYGVATRGLCWANRERLPSLCRVNPGVPDTRQPPCGGGEARWMTEASARLRCEHIPVILNLPCSGSCLPNKEWPRELGGASQKPRGKPQSTTPHHDGPQSLPHFWTATCQRSVWLTSASPHHLAWEKPPS